MAATLITEGDVRVPRGQRTAFVVTMSPAEDVSAWVDVRLTLRLDPEYPRRGAAKLAADRGEVDVSGWESVTDEPIEATVVDAEEGVFRFELPRADALGMEVGFRRGVLDVLRTDDGEEIQVVEPTWFHVVESVYDG
jgi:hypothetical protein